MNKLKNSEIAKVFAMYWGCKCSYLRTKSDSTKERTLTTIDIDYHPSLLIQRDGILQLKSLEDITDEDVKHTMCFIGGWAATDWVKKNIGKQIMNNAAIYQVLMSKGYAVPLFFGINHWANGKTAIELGIAVDEKP